MNRLTAELDSITPMLASEEELLRDIIAIITVSGINNACITHNASALQTTVTLRARTIYLRRIKYIYYICPPHCKLSNIMEYFQVIFISVLCYAYIIVY